MCPPVSGMSRQSFRVEDVCIQIRGLLFCVFSLCLHLFQVLAFISFLPADISPHGAFDLSPPTIALIFSIPAATISFTHLSVLLAFLAFLT